MNVGLISYRFARALYDFSASAAEEDKVYHELKLLLSQINRIPEFSDALVSPIVPQENKMKLLKIATGVDVSNSVLRFFKLLIDHKREDILADICHSYKLIYDEEKGVLRVRLATAIPIDDDRISRILKKLGNSTGKKIELTHVVQPEIIGGYVLTTDEKRLDASVRTRLMNIRKKLTI